MEQTKWNENVILVQADYADRVASNLKDSFEQMLKRPIPKVDLAQWIVCMALDGGLTPGKNEVNVLFIHSKEKKAFSHFLPADFRRDLDGKSFDDPHLGTFSLSSLRIENLISGGEFFVQAFETLADAKEIKRLIVVSDLAECRDKLLSIWKKIEEKELTLLTMEPVRDDQIHQDLLGYSLMHAMGIRSEEFK